MAHMNELHLNDGGIIDPYSKAVKDFLSTLEERFPEGISHSLQFRALLELLAVNRGMIHSERIEAHYLCEVLVTQAETFSIPQRDLVLMHERFRHCERMKQLFLGPAQAVQRALEEAYMDSIFSERGQLTALANSRDVVFETAVAPQSLEDFLRTLENLVLSRKNNGGPAWRQLEQHCHYLENIFAGVRKL